MSSYRISMSRRMGNAAVSGILALTLAGALVPAVASAEPANEYVAEGEDWSIAEVAGGYEVVKNIDEPLPVVSDLPAIEVDGEPIGLARESADGLTLSAVTDLDVTDAQDVEVVWATGGEKAEPYDAPVTSETEPVEPQSSSLMRTNAVDDADDGSAPGTISYLEDDYDFGDQAIDLAAIGGIRGEMTGRIYLPTTSGPHPTIILLHGRHTSCSGSPSNPNRWPCTPTQVKIPSYKGYETLAQTLATHGYAVVSISANAINANDNQLALDYGAQARGRLVLDTLEMLRKANAGEAVSYYDAATDATVDLASALQVETESFDQGSAPVSATNPGTPILPTDLVGKFDLDNVGLMGHSRGGEGVASAVSLNQADPEPFGITSVLPLAPVDFGRQNIVDTPTLVILPYCDGDVSNQQGQHFNDDSRYSYDDNVLRSTLWVMGANHNFFNDVWTPGKYPLAVSDDWRAADSVCNTSAETTQRLSADDQYQVGVATMAAWFRLTVGGEEQFLPMFDGSTDPQLDTVPEAWLWTHATVPSQSRQEIETFTARSSKVRFGGSATANICASTTGMTLQQDMPPCATVNSVRSSSAMPHWTPVRFSANVPSSPMARFLWTATTGTSAGFVRVIVPESARDASAYDMLTFKTAPDEAVEQATDMVVRVLDGSGASWSAPVSTLNQAAVTRLPASGSTTLNKIVLQQVRIPTQTLAEFVDVTDIREVRFEAAAGPNGETTGGAYLSDLEWASGAVGESAGYTQVPTVNVAPTKVEEGATTYTAKMAVTLSEPVDEPVSAWFALIGSTSTTAAAGLAVDKVTFAPGQTCQAVDVTINGNTAAGSQATTSYTAAASVPDGVIAGAGAFASLTIREDDGLTSSGTSAAEVGTQGDVCAEATAAATTQDLSVSDEKPAPGDEFTVVGDGFRAGEAVEFALDGEPIATVIADEAGVASSSWTLEYATGLGNHTVTATGQGSARVAEHSFALLAPTFTALVLNPQAPELGEPVTLTATVSGSDTQGTVTFSDDGKTLGTAEVVDGQATLTLPKGLSVGSHKLSASFAQTQTANASESAALMFTLDKNATTTVLSVASGSQVYGSSTPAAVAVAGASGGKAQVKIGSTSLAVSLDASGRGKFSIPKTLKPGSYSVSVTYSGSDSVAASSVSGTFTVTKAKPVVTVSAPAKAKRGKSISVKVKVAGVSGVAGPSSKVVVKFGGKKVATFKAPASGSTVTKKFKVKKAGVSKLKVTVKKSAQYTKASVTKKVKVTKR